MARRDRWRGGGRSGHLFDLLQGLAVDRHDLEPGHHRDLVVVVQFDRIVEQVLEPVADDFQVLLGTGADRDDAEGVGRDVADRVAVAQSFADRFVRSDHSPVFEKEPTGLLFFVFRLS